MMPAGSTASAPRAGAVGADGLLGAGATPPPPAGPAGARRPVGTGLRGVLLLPAGLALLAGLDAALLLLGLPAPVTAGRLPEVHGMLLVFGVVGTLIALGRAVALRRRLGYLAPALLGAGGLLLLTPAPLVTGRAVLLAGAAAMVGVCVPLWRRERDAAGLVQAFGAVLGVGALVLWLGGVAVPVLLPWLVGFLVLTIGGERLALTRPVTGAGADRDLVLCAGGLALGIVAALLWPAVGHPLFGLALLVLAGRLAFHDVARRTITGTGLPRLVGACMLAGYAWLAVAGALWLTAGPAVSGARYDAVVQAVLLGFALSMILANAPVVLTAVLRRPLPYPPLLYVPAVLLHGSLVLRLWLGDALGSHTARQTGGVLNVIALLLFVVVASTASWRATRGTA